MSNLLLNQDHSNQPKSFPWLRFIFMSVLVSGLIYFGFWISQNYEMILFQFKDDKYKAVLEKYQVIDTKLKKEGVAAELDSKQITQFIELLDTLLAAKNEDANLHRLKAQLYTTLFRAPLATNSPEMIDIFFNQFIDHFSFPARLNYQHWQKAIIASRKALALGLASSEDRNTLKNQLAFLYLWGGKPYLFSAQELVTNISITESDDITIDLINIIFTTRPPRFKLLMQSYEKNLVSLWQAIYYLRIRNAPLAISLLRRLEKTQGDSPEIIQIKNNALYLQGHIKKTQRNTRGQLFHLSKIDMEEFLPRQPWFLQEYTYVLRFLGKRREAISVYEKYAKDATN